MKKVSFRRRIFVLFSQDDLGPLTERLQGRDSCQSGSWVLTQFLLDCETVLSAWTEFMIICFIMEIFMIICFIMEGFMISCLIMDSIICFIMDSIHDSQK